MTQTRLAKILGCTKQVVSHHVKTGNAPALDDVVGWTAHLAALGRIGSQASADLKQKIAEQRLAILKASREKLERENQIQGGKLMLIADAERQAAEACQFLMSELERGERELPPALAGLDAVAVYKKLHEFIEALRRNAKQKFQEVGK